MSKRARRIVVTLTVCVFAALIVWAVFYGKTRRQGGTGPATQSVAAATQPATTTAPNPIAGVATQPAAAPGGATSSTTAPAGASLTSLRALAAGNDIASRDQPPQPLGSLDPRRDLMQVHLSRFGAGITRIEFADLWQTALAKRDAQRYLKDLPPDQPIDTARLPEDQRFVLVTRSPSKSFDEPTQLWLYSQVPVMAVRWLIIDGVAIDMLNDDAWSETAPGVFESRIVNADGKDVARVARRFRLGAGYDVAMEQRVQNLSDRAMQVAWQQYGPVDLPKDKGYIERYRLHFGYLPDPRGRPTLVLADDSNVIERGSAVKQATNATNAQAALLWPNAGSTGSGWGLSWFATTNRYFGLAVHPPLAGDQPAAFSLGDSVQEIAVGASNVGQHNETLFTTLHSAAVNVAPGAEQPFDLALYAGPLDRGVLHQSAYDALAMHGMIVYSMGSCCAFLTFQWLAHILLWFLSFLHDYLFFDWGLAIIGLVIVVRSLLHPITKKSQINMQRLGRKMSTLKPEMDKIAKRYANDPNAKTKVQQENLRLMREHGVNPLQFLGCLTLFLQMPIWIALWAMLYLAFDIRQQPAFYGVFQLFWDWPFLADLSSEDSFIPLGAGFDIPLVGWHVSALNLLPILMGVVFFIQQKYMTPPTTANMTPEQIQQQKIMKWMTVILFPVMMYPSPSGLTLYIMTSSIIGILESRYIRKHIDEIDKNPPQAGGPGNAGPKKPRGALGRAWAERLEAIRHQAQQRQQEQRSFKKRK